MLKPCPECEMQVSDKATVCPHCGFPLHSSLVGTVHKSRRRHARLPNGFGQITELRGRNLRKPFRVMITVGVNPRESPSLSSSSPSPISKPITMPIKPSWNITSAPTT